ncbi:MAG: peptide deformylase [Planctomycetota bacterium]|jgi:peptide deformylase
MSSAEKIAAADLAHLSVVHYPDPRLRETCSEIETVDGDVRSLAARMFDLMFANKGVGLAAPQVGVTVRMLVASPSFDEADRIVLVNPRIVGEDGWEEMEEGCLSFPGIFCQVRRRTSIVLEALDLDGQPINETVEGFAARVIQHEIDHLDGQLLVDRMSQVAKLANRKALKQLETEFDCA